MELRHLRYFVAVADDLSFTKAARRVRVAQPALSRQIRQLEEEIGVRLLERTRRQVSLTAAGRAFLDEARTVLAQSQHAVSSAQAAGDGSTGVLNLGYVWGLFHSLVPPLLAEFRRTHPEISVNLLDVTATQQAEWLLEGKLDAGFIGFAEEAGRVALACRCVGACELVAVLPRNHRLARRRRIELAALAPEFFIAVSESSYPGAAHAIADVCNKAGFRPKVLQAAERGFAILGLVAANCGVALLPATLRALPHPGVVFRHLTEAPIRELFLAWNERRSLPLRDRFIHQLAA